MYMAQRRRKISVSAIRELSKLQVGEREAAAFFGVRLKTFRELLRVDVRAREAWEDGRELGRLSLRQKQFKLAGESATMAIFLGKQWLGQNEVSTIQHTGAEGGPIKTLDLGALTKEQRGSLREVLMAARKK